MLRMLRHQDKKWETQYRRRVSARYACSLTLLLFLFESKEKPQKLNRLSKEGKWLLRNLPEYIYFSFRIKRKVTKERLVAVTGVEPVRSYPADFKSAASTNSATPP